MTHRITVRVYYEDTDMAGVVYYANYLKFIERGRTDALRDAGIDQSAMQRDLGLVFVVTRVEADYLSPARFDDLLEVTTATARLRGASVQMAQEVRCGGQRLFCAQVTVACMGPDGHPRRLPEPVRDSLESLVER